LGDYMRDPYSMLHRFDSSEGVPTKVDDLNLDYLEGLYRSMDSLFSASHLNFNHFQGRAMHSFWFWHKQAVNVGRTNLMAALVLEAYAQHYLQDFFAPGHVIAPRDEGTHDLFAVTLHDNYNQQGLGYLV